MWAGGVPAHFGEMIMADLRYHVCTEDPEVTEYWGEYDARGIYLCRVCDKCRDAKLSKYRPDVLTDSNYWADEPIDYDY